MPIIKSSRGARTHGARRAPRDLGGLLAQLDAPPADERRRAARDLGAHPEASPGLVRRLEREQDLSVRAVIFSSLARIADPVAIAGLVACLRSEDAGLRNEAIDVLKSRPAEMAPIMRGLLADPVPDVRILAVNILESLRHPDVESWLVEVIERDPAVNVCGAALDLLTELASAASREPLQRLQRRFASEPYIEFAVELALQRLAKE